MKKRLLIPIVIVLTLVISLSAMAIAVSASNGDPKLTVVGANLSFEENVHILYAVDYENIDNPANIRLLIFRGNDVNVNNCTLAEADTAIAPSGIVEDDKNGVEGLMFEYSQLNASEMTEDVYARAYYELEDGSLVYSPVVKYSILQYAMNMLGVTGTPTDDAKLANMLEKMLAYGAAAQEVFNVNIDRLATDEYVKVNFDGATLKDGLSYGLLKKGQTVDVFAPVDETNKYALWLDANGNAVGNGGKIEYTAKTNATIKASVQATEPSYGAYDRVIIVGVDGAGSFYPDHVNAESTRIQQKIFGNGSVTRTMHVGIPTSSCVGWSGLLHGVKPENLGYVENIVVEEAETYPLNSKYPSILKLVKDAYPEEEVAALYKWIGIHGIVEQNYGITTLNSNNDVDLTDYIVDTYLKDNAPKMMFVHLGNPDYVGHTDGHHTEPYYSSIDTAYTQIEDIYDAIMAQDAANGTSTLFIVTTDHGGINLGHGGLTDYEKYGMFAVAGKTVVSGGAAQDMQLRDGATVALYALGIAQPETYTSAMPAGIFEGVEASTRKEYHDPDNSRYHLPEQTPAAGNSNYITNFVNNNLLAYLPFDGDTNDVYGREVKEFGKITYEDGYFGQGVNLDGGHLNIMNFAPGNDSFTLAFWMKMPSPSMSSPIITNKVSDTSEQGFTLLAERTGPDYLKFRFNFGNGLVSATEDVDLPEDYFCGWMHVTLSFDRANETMTLCYDFGEMYTIPINSIHATMEGTSMTTIYDYLVLGNDVTGEVAERKCGLSVDEFMYFDGAFTRNDINDLSEYFNRTPVVEDENVEDEKNVTDVFAENAKPDLYFDFNGTMNNKGTADVNVSMQGGRVPFVEGVDGQAAYFDGKGYLSVDNFDLGTGSYTFSFWLQPMDMVTGEGNGTTRYCVPIMSNTDGISRANAGISILLNCEYDRIYVTMGDGSGNGFNQGYDLPAADYEKQWTHITIVADRAASGGNFDLYVNFTELVALEKQYYDTDKINCTDGTPYTSGASSDNPFNIGQFGDVSANGNVNRTLLANIDDLMVFKRAITSAEITAIRYYYTNPLEDYITKAPVLNMGFNGDLTNEGSYNGAIVEEGTLNYVNGYIGNAANFKNGAVELTDYKFGNDSYTISFWMNSDCISYNTSTEFYNTVIMGTMDSSSDTNVGFRLAYARDNNALIFYASEGNNPYYALVSYGDTHVANEWMHVTVVFDRTSGWKIYYNFVEYPITGGWWYDKPEVLSLPADSNNAFHIGQDGTGNAAHPYEKTLDEILIFNSALTADEVAKLGEYYAQFN